MLQVLLWKEKYSRNFFATIKEYFNKSDKNKDNVLGVEEMRDLLQKTYKVKMSLPQTRVLIDRYDKNGDRKFHL